MKSLIELFLMAWITLIGEPFRSNIEDLFVVEFLVMALPMACDKWVLPKPVSPKITRD